MGGAIAYRWNHHLLRGVPKITFTKNKLSLWMIRWFLYREWLHFCALRCCCWYGTDTAEFQLMGKQLHIFIDHFPIWQIFVKHLLCPGLPPGPGGYIVPMTCAHEACQVEGKTSKHLVHIIRTFTTMLRGTILFPILYILAAETLKPILQTSGLQTWLSLHPFP